MANSKGDVVVETEFNNIFVLNPNKVYDENGDAVDRTIPQEDLVYYANLECVAEPRSFLINGAESGTMELYSIATTNINFLKPKGKNYFTTDWTNITFDTSESEKINSELLGIVSIDYRIGLSVTPSVQIILEDVRGRALFESGNDSVYSIFFNMPPPIFYLTMKGYYGKAIRFPLWLKSFKATLQDTTGNFQIVLDFTGYKFTILTDVTLADLYAVPHMYPKNSTQNVGGQLQNQTNGNGTTQTTPQGRTYLGTEYIKRVFDNYKDLKILDKNFPVITVPQLINLTENFVADSLKELGQENAESLTSLDNYADALTQYKKVVYADSKNSWFSKNTDLVNFWITTYVEEGKTKYKRLYLRKNTKPHKDQYSELKEIVRSNNFKLLSNSVMGDGGLYSIKKIPTINSVKLDREDTTINLIDIRATIKEREGIENPNESQIELYKKDLLVTIEIYEKECSEAAKNNEEILPLFYYYTGPNSIKNILNDVEKIYNKSKAEFENDLTDKIAKKLESPKALGFKPTAKNIAAIIFASTEAFLRLLSDVHKKAFNQRNNELKKGAVPSDIDNDVTNSPVYPWPEFAVNLPDEKGDNKVVLAYPGDPKYVDLTNGDDFTIWPEIEFVEKYVEGFLQRNIPPINTLQSNTGLEKFLIAGFDTVPNNEPYSDLEEVLFSFELFERIYSFSQYQGFIRSEYDEFMDLFTEAETNNILRELVKSPFLVRQFQENTFSNTQQYFNYLYEISRQGTSTEFQSLIRGEISNTYLRDNVLKSVEFFDYDIDSPIVSVGNETPLVNYFEKKISHAKTYFTDLYPFVYQNWIAANIPNGINNPKPIDTNDTRKSLFFNQVTKKVSNYKTDKAAGLSGDKRSNRPFTDFKIFNEKINNPVDLSNFYDSNNFSLTEGVIYYEDNYEGNLNNTQRTSLLNTPYFINALQEGIDNQRNGSEFPYTAATYLFLQSLPLATLKEKYISKNITGQADYLSVIASTIKKFGGVHSLPRLWVCKLGAIWHRYKIYLESDETNDIVESSWTDFDQDSNYDPINSDPTRVYTLILPDSQDETVNRTVNISLQTSITNQAGQTTDVMNLGFYPKLINDMSYFLNGTDLFSDINNLDAEIQSKISNKQMFVFSPSDSNIYQPLYDGTKNLVLSTWSILIKDNFSEDLYTLPSFGSTTNQVKYECFNNVNTMTLNPFGNQSVYNGSVRTLWGVPQFGYFEANNLVPPLPDEHYKTIYENTNKQNPFELKTPNVSINYSKIEEIFSVFTKDELDVFEEEFKKFSDVAYNVKGDFTFQTIMKNLLKSNYEISGATENELVQKIQNTQNTTLSTYLTSEINYNWLVKISNPTHFNLQGLNYFTSGTTQSNIYQSVFPEIQSYDLTTPDALPFNGGSITLENSVLNYPDVWKTLKLYVGFSTVSGISYSDSGSFITDFFIDNDIAFSSENIIYFQDAIKIFATQKLLNEINPTQTWQVLVNSYFRDIATFSNIYFRQVFSTLRTSLKGGNTKKSPELIGDVTKLEYYRRFKAINDKWISQLDYNRETLFSDVTFNDRGNKDVGDKVFLDIDIVKKFLKGNLKSPVEAVFRNIMITNNFVVTSLPAYINFYGVPSPTGKDENTGEVGTQLSNSLFGIFKEVDYQETRSKIVCLFSPPPSEHVAKTNNTQKNLFGYNDDGLYLQRQLDNPVYENPDKKVDFATSNKVVGIAVDLGLQNQQVFKTFSFSQDNGKNTSESIAANVKLRNIQSGVESSPQTQSLFNIYLLRNYQGSVTLMGNAMIQPTQYFVLRNVPLFAGSYWIQNVTHTINEGGFTTTITGSRQAVREIPTDSLYLQSIKKSYLSKIVKDNKQSRQTDKGPSNNIITLKNEAKSFQQQKQAAQVNNCVPNVKYSTFISVTPTVTEQTFTQVKDALYNMGLPQDARLSIFTIFLMESNFDPNANAFSFSTFNNNFAGIPLSRQWGGAIQYVREEFICLEQGSPAVLDSYAVFDNIGACINFCNAKYMESLRNRITNFGDKDIFVESFSRAYIEIFPYNKLSDAPNIYEDFINTNQQDFDKMKTLIGQAFEYAKGLNL